MVNIKAQSHCFVIDKAIDVLARNGYADFKKHRIALMRSSKRLDRSLILLSSRHFYNPSLNKGFHRFRNAKKEGYRLFAKAVRLHNKGKIKKSIKCLGYAMHILADMCTPAHTNLSFHYFATDDFENYLNANLYRFKSQSFELSIEGNKRAIDLYEEASRASSSYIARRNNFLKSISFKLLKAKPRDRLPFIELERQINDIVPKAIKYNAELLHRFIMLINKQRA